MVLLLLLLLLMVVLGTTGSLFRVRVKVAELFDFGKVSAVMINLFPLDFTRIFGNVLIVKNRVGKTSLSSDKNTFISLI